MTRNPKTKIKPSLDKSASFSKLSAPNYNEFCPAWCFSRIDLEGKWGWINADSELIIEKILPKIKNFETMTWGELQKDRRKHHSMPIRELSKFARQRLDELLIFEDSLFSFKIDGYKRIWVVKDKYMYFILWWDPEHTVYPVKKKHT